MLKGNRKPGFDYGEASKAGDFEWNPKISRPKQSPTATGRDLGERHPVKHDPDWYAYETGKPGPLPRK